MEKPRISEYSTSETLRNFWQSDLSESLASTLYDEIKIKLSDGCIEKMEFNCNVTDIYIDKVAGEVRLESIFADIDDFPTSTIDEFMSSLKIYLESGYTKGASMT